MSKKKKWSEWAHEYVRKEGKCPGETPPFGLPESLVTEEEFLESMSVCDKHKWNNCHFGAGKDVVDPIESPPVGTKRMIVKDGAEMKDVQKMVGPLEEVMDSQRIVMLKRNLHSFVERITLDDKGVLHVPDPILDIRVYIGKFFEVK